MAVFGRIWRFSAVWVLIAVIGSLSLEGLYRLYLNYFYTRLEPVVPAAVGQFDERLGWSLKPMSKAVSRRTGYEIEYRINSKGLRDDETTFSKPKGIFRIVVLGDSATFGYGVPIEKHYTTLLEGYRKNLEVIAMGVSGFGIDQELLYLKLEGFRYEPDLVLVYVGTFGEHRHMYKKRFGKQKPRFVLQQGKLVLENSPVPKEKTGTAPGSIQIFLLAHSEVYRAVYQWRQRSRIAEENLKNDNQSGQFLKDFYELAEAIIKEMYKESMRHGAKFVLVTKFDKLMEFCLKESILCLDLSKALSNRKLKLPDKHPNESGHGVIAWEIARFLEANGLLTAEASSSTPSP